MKQLSALGVRRNFFQQQHVHHLAARRMRLSESECESRDAFGPDDLPPDVMAEILHMPLLQAPQQTQSYQSSLFCVDAQRVSLLVPFYLKDHSIIYNNAVFALR